MNYEFDKNIKKVAFFHSHNLWPSHLESELELMQYFTNLDTEIISYVCNDVLQQCDANQSKNLYYCSKCIKKRSVGLQLSGKKIREINIQLIGPSFVLDKNMSIDDFKKIKHKNFDVGYAVLSSVVSIYRDAYSTVAKYYEDFSVFLYNSIKLYNFFLESLATEKPDLVLIFNGRFAYTRALIRACEYLDIKFYTHERGSNSKKFMLYEQTLPHDLNYFYQVMTSAWNNTTIDTKDKSAIAENYYKERAAGKNQSWFSFISNQDKESLPKNWDESKYNIGVFLSSEDEFIAIGDMWEKGLFVNQLEGLEYIFKSIPMHKDVHFYIRIHPNSKLSYEFIEKLEAYQNEVVTVIHPTSTLSTYKLMNGVDKVVTFGSTVGIEASFWGKTSINLANSFYKKLNATYNPLSPEEAINMIMDKNLPAISKDKTFPYAYHLATFGYTFKDYNSDSIMEGTFKGKDLNAVVGIKNLVIDRVHFLPKRVKNKIRNLEFKVKYFILKYKVSHGKV